MKLLLFDVDGTLTKSTLRLSDKMIEILKKIFQSSREEYEMCLVSGGTYEKIIYQIGKENEKLFTYIFSENPWKNATLIGQWAILRGDELDALEAATLHKEVTHMIVRVGYEKEINQK